MLARGRPLCGQDEFAIVCQKPDGSFNFFQAALKQLSRWIG
jgi:hypothetical protein